MGSSIAFEMRVWPFPRDILKSQELALLRDMFASALQAALQKSKLWSLFWMALCSQDTPILTQTHHLWVGAGCLLAGLECWGGTDRCCLWKVTQTHQGTDLSKACSEARLNNVGWSGLTPASERCLPYLHIALRWPSGLSRPPQEHRQTKQRCNVPIRGTTLLATGSAHKHNKKTFLFPCTAEWGEQ